MTPCIHIVLAVFRPDAGFLDQQIASIAAQTYENHRLVAVIADADSAALVSDTSKHHGVRFTLVEPDTTLDAVRAFEAGLAQALLDIERDTENNALIALCDQDDVWHPDRLAHGVARLAETGADLLHSDARLVDAGGAVTHPSMFRYERRHRAPGLRGLLYRNNVTGMTVLMRPGVARLALPFPQQSGVHFYHDLWLALLAAATGGVTFLDAPLVDYRQHGGNAIGAVARESAPTPGLRLPDQAWLRREAASYAVARFLALSVAARIDKAARNGDGAAQKANLSPLRPFTRRLRGGGRLMLDALMLATTGHGRLARIAAGFSVVAVGRSLWSLKLAMGPGLSQAFGDFDARLWSLAPGNPPENSAEEDAGTAPAKVAADFTDQRQHARWVPDFSAPAPSVNILVPTLNPTEVFAGIVTALDIGLGLAQRGLRVRLIATDLPVFSAAASRGFVLKRLGREAQASGAEARISLHCGATSATLPAHPGDVFLATAWWTAHLADGLIRAHGFAQKEFLYLIQDFEPNFYAWGPEFAGAMASYDLSFRPVFNTTLLRDYFASQSFGFARPEALAFHPAIEIDRYADGQRRAQSGPRRLALYGRPEVARNMFGTSIEALDRFITATGLGPEQIDPVSVGLRHAPISLSNGVTLRSLGKLPWDDYPDFLLGCDLGLSLMYSPHPSHPPIEMAASGVRVVTNSFGPKDLSRLSPAILSGPATGPALADLLSRAWTLPAVTDKERRISLTALGVAPETMVDRLATGLRAQMTKDND